MTNEEAKKNLKEWLDNDGIGVIGAVDFILALNALEKQIPKKPANTPDHNKYFCPVCHRPIKLGRQYCGNCGQKIGYGSDTE